MNAKEEVQEEIWLTSSGPAIKVADMDEQHVRNTLRLLIRVLRQGKLSRLDYFHKRLARAAKFESYELIKVIDPNWLDDWADDMEHGDRR